MTMREMDEIADDSAALSKTSRRSQASLRSSSTLHRTAQSKCDTLSHDHDVFDVWTTFVVAGESLSGFQPRLSAAPTLPEQRAATRGTELVSAKELISYIARARVCMPKSTAELLERCRQYRSDCTASGHWHSALHLS